MRGRLLKENELAWWHADFLMKDFASNEIKPLEEIRRLYAEGKYEIHIYQSRDDVYVGYAALWTTAEHTYTLDYLDIKNNSRGEQAVEEEIMDDIRGNLQTIDREARLIIKNKKI